MHILHYLENLYQNNINQNEVNKTFTYDLHTKHIKKPLSNLA